MIGGGLEILCDRSLAARYDRQEQQRHEAIWAARALVCEERFAQLPLAFGGGGSRPVDAESFERFGGAEWYDVLHASTLCRIGIEREHVIR